MKKTLFILSLVLSACPSISFAQHYYAPKEVLAYLFPDSKTVVFEKKSLAPKQVDSIRKSLRTKDIKTDWTIYIAKSKNKTDGYAIIDNVIGKEKPITYVVSISPEGVVNEVEILEYRESHGGQVKNKAYRKQFVGKSPSDPLQIGRDIRHVSGATISSKSIAFGVKRALMVWEVLYKPR